MAYEIPGQLVSFTAGGDLSAKQFYWVKLNSSSQVVACDTDGEHALGIVQNAPASGREATVMLSGISKVILSETVAAGNLVGTTSAGKTTIVEATATGADVGDFVMGVVLEGVTVSAGTETGTVLIRPQGRVTA